MANETTNVITTAKAIELNKSTPALLAIVLTVVVIEEITFLPPENSL
ncbi:hypothetical protein ACFLX3_01775 [Chloroflexota bacterium]